MSRNVRQTWRPGVRRREKNSPSGGNFCAKAERLERVCLVPRNKNKFITDEGKSARRRVARGEGRQCKDFQASGRLDSVFYYGAMRNHCRGRKSSDLVASKC